MVTTLSKDKIIENIAIEAAAEEYIARQEMRSHPAVAEDFKDRFVLAEEERRECCTPFLKQRFKLNQHTRSAKHVANLFDVDVRAMMEVVISMKKE